MSPNRLVLGGEVTLTGWCYVMDQAPYQIRPMRREEVNLAIEWAAREGWNPGLHDAEAFHAADPQGFLVGLLDGEPVATLSAVRYGADFGFMGFYIVDPSYRGRGYGLQLWNAGLAHLAGRNIGLDGVLAQQGNYQKSGFKLAYRNIRFEGRARESLSSAASITPASALSFDLLESYDRGFFPAARTTFLHHWLEQPGAQTRAVVIDGQVKGYGVIRPCRSGHKIGPLAADDPGLASALFDSLVSQVETSAPIFLDVPEVNPEAVALAQKNGMTAVFETARMYTGEAPRLPFEKMFGVTSFELG
jgi:ribosomal protein S18 acetylase RimI-like enzyme